jgi:hypothetical protein
MNSWGQLGQNSTSNYSSPIQVGTLTNWKRVVCSSRGAIAIKTDGTLWTWGYNAMGQLGINNTTNMSSPVQVGTLTNWKSVAGGGHAIKTDCTLWAWGPNAISLGINISSPVQVGALTNWKQVSSTKNNTRITAITFNDIT